MDDILPLDFVDSQLNAESLDDVEIPVMPSSDMEGVTDGTTSTDIGTVVDNTNVTVVVTGMETTQTYETEPKNIGTFVPVKAYHYDENGNFIIDEE